MIIIEGPDNSGKSELCRKLSLLIKWEVEHSKVPNLEQYEGEDKEFMAYMHALRHITPAPLIRDRTYAISENVYGPVIRNKSMLGVFSGRSLHYLANSQCLIIFCRPPTKKIVSDKARDQMDGVRENHLQLIERYDKIATVLEDSGAFVYRYDYTDKKALDKIVHAVRTHANMFQLSQETIHDFIKS